MVPCKATTHRLSKSALINVFGAFGSDVSVHSNTNLAAELEFDSYSGWSYYCLNTCFVPFAGKIEF